MVLVRAGLQIVGLTGKSKSTWAVDFLGLGSCEWIQQVRYKAPSIIIKVEFSQAAIAEILQETQDILIS